MKKEILSNLQRSLATEYLSYKQGLISEQEYLARARPIDMEISKLEISTLQGTPAWTEAFSLHTLKQVC